MRNRRVAATAWTLLIMIACSIPGTDLPRIDVDYFDKLAHLTLFAGYGWLWMRASAQPAVRAATVVVVTGLVLAIASEIYQGMLPWDRTPDPLDALFDAIGLVIAVVCHILVHNGRQGLRTG